MDCKEFSNLLDAYMEGALSEEQARQMRMHGENCPACANLLAALQDCRALDEDVEVPASFETSWRQMVREECGMTEKKKRISRGMRNWLAAAAALVLVLGGTLLTRDQLSLDSDFKNNGNGSMTYSSRSRNSAPLETYDSSAVTSDYELAAYGAAEESAPQEEKIIRTASFTLKTLSFEEDLGKMQNLTAEMGGRVEYLYTSGDKESGQLRSANLTLRIPSSRLDDFLSGAQGVGRVTSLQQEVEDVSNVYYDVQSRLETQQTKMARLQALMDAAESVSDLIEIESAVADTQYWIDHYTGQLNHYDNQVDYSTVQVYLREIEIQEAEEISLGQRILSGLENSLEDGALFLEDLLVFLVALAPWALGVGAIVVVIVLVVRARRRNNKESRES